MGRRDAKQDGIEPDLVGGAGGVRHVIYHDTLAGGRVTSILEGNFKGGQHGFAVRGDGQDVDDAVKVLFNLEYAQDTPGVVKVGIGEDKFSAGEAGEDGCEDGVGLDVVSQRDVMDKGQVVGHINVISGLKAAQSGAIFFEELLAEGLDLLLGDIEALAHVEADTVFYLGP